MSERIFVTYSLASGIPYTGPTLGSHAIVNYVDKKGTHYTAQGLPTNKFNDTLAKALAAITAEVGGETPNTDSPFGKIQVVVNTAAPDAPDLPGEMIISGDDLSEEWDAIVKRALEIDRRFEYLPASQNSNTVAADLLKAAGLRAPVGISNEGIPEYLGDSLGPIITNRPKCLSGESLNHVNRL